MNACKAQAEEIVKAELIYDWAKMCIRDRPISAFCRGKIGSLLQSRRVLRSIPCPLRSRTGCWPTVSYTHLDVYKRQVHVKCYFTEKITWQEYNKSMKLNSNNKVVGTTWSNYWRLSLIHIFDTLHDFQSCALDQLSHLSIFGCTPQRHTIIPERCAFVKHFFF